MSCSRRQSKQMNFFSMCHRWKGVCKRPAQAWQGAMGNCCGPVCCTAHAEALPRLAQGDLAQPHWSPGATAMVLHHMERLELHGIWRAEAEVALKGGASVRAACQ